MQAPVPFVVGMQYKTDDVAALIGGLVRVNVGKDTVQRLPPSNRPSCDIMYCSVPCPATPCDHARNCATML